MTLRPSVLGLIAVCLSLAPATVRAHAVHSAVVEMELNHEAMRVEVALRLFLDDLETALSARAGKPIRAEKVPAAEFAALATAYLRETLVLLDPQGTPARLEWIGRELKDAANEAWLFVQFAAPARIDGTRMRVTLLREQFSDQLTSVQIRDGERRLALLFPPGDTERVIGWPR